MASALALLGFACDSEYPLEPTFCDDWCRATLMCDESPSNCVSECELTKASDACFDSQRELLDCYESADASDFACVPRGFQPDTVVITSACRAERDALFECTAPGISGCLQLCRQTQREQFDSIIDPKTGQLRPPFVANPDAGADDQCPLLDEPCEDICWTVFSFTSAGLAAAGVEPSASNGTGSGPDAGFELPESVTCLQSVLLGCFLGFAPGVPLPPEAPATPSNDGGSGSDESTTAGASIPPTLDELFQQCLE